MDLNKKEKISQPEQRAAPEKFEAVEAPVTPERVMAPGEEQEAATVAELPSAAPPTAPAPAAPAGGLPPPPAIKNAALLKVENILAEDLNEAYQSMTPELQTKFRTEGERVAGLIWQMMATAKVQTKKILELIVHWLKMIPGVNRYFLEQESKIKTDKIIVLSKKNE